MPRTTLLVTRPVDSATRFVARLSDVALGQVNVVISPLLEIVPLKVQADLSHYAAAVFSSAQAVGFAPRGGGKPAYCVGAMTAAAARHHGWQVRLEGETAQDVIGHLLQAPLSGTICHFSGKYQRGDIANTLTRHNLPCDRVILYDQKMCALTDDALTALKGRTIVPLFSPRTARGFVAQVAPPAHAHVVALSPAVAAPCIAAGFEKVDVLSNPTGAAMVETIEGICQGTATPHVR